MKYQYIPYIWPLIASALASMSLGIYALVGRRNAKGATSFILSMFVVSIWSLGNALEMASVDFSTKLFWANVQYFAYCFSPVTLLAMCMEFTGYDQWIRNKKVLWFAALPTIIILLVWTDGFHGLMRYDMQMDFSGSFPVISKKYGPVFWVHALYSQFLNLYAAFLLIRAVFFKNTVYMKQATSLLIGVSLIVVPNILYILGISPVKRFDITPMFFAPAGLIVAWGIFRYRLFDLVPVAWTTVIKTMDVGVMVLDLQDRVLDINPAFERIVGSTASMAAAKPIRDVCSKIPELAVLFEHKGIVKREISVNNGEGTKFYEVFLSPLDDDNGKLMGRLTVIYNITDKKQEQHISPQIICQQNSNVDNDFPLTDSNDTQSILSERQLEVLELAAQGITYKEIGEILGLSERTVKYHMSRIIDLLHLENRSQVFAYAARLRLVKDK